MTRFRGPVLAGLCLATIAACCGFLPTASVAADDYLGVTFGFSPAKAQYYPGEDFSLEVTAVDLMPTPSTALDPLLNYVKVVNVSAHFSWMALEEDGWTYVSDTSTWLAPDQEGSETYALDLSVPVSATAQTYDYRIDVEYVLRSAWGNITYTWTESYHDFVVSKDTSTSLAMAFEFSPAKAAYAPGEEFTADVTVTNALPSGVSAYDVFPCRVTNVSVHFSWMAADEYVWNDLSDGDLWLSPDGTVSETYVLNLTVPEDASETTHSYSFKVEYVEAVPWGEESYTWGTGIFYRDFAVSSDSSGILGGTVDYVPYLAAIAIVLSVGALGAALYYRHGREEGARRALAAGSGRRPTVFDNGHGDAYPAIRPVPGGGFPVERGLTYLVKEKRPNVAFGMFNEAVRAGAKGMLVVREHPNRLQQMYEFDAESILWLTRRTGKDHIDPTELSLVSLKMTRFVEESKRSVVLIEGLEYLITQNDFETVLRFVNHMHDYVLTHDCAIIVVVDPRVLSTKELALLERSARVVEPLEAVEPAPQPSAETGRSEA